MTNSEKFKSTDADKEAELKTEQARWELIDYDLPLSEVNPDAVEILLSKEYQDQIIREVGGDATSKTVELSEVSSEPAAPNPMDVVKQK